jgi:hypothetical protein
VAEKHKKIKQRLQEVAEGRSDTAGVAFGHLSSFTNTSSLLMIKRELYIILQISINEFMDNA